jgi:hypothetical protein
VEQGITGVVLASPPGGGPAPFPEAGRSWPGTFEPAAGPRSPEYEDVEVLELLTTGVWVAVTQLPSLPRFEIVVAAFEELWLPLLDQVPVAEPPATT